MIRLKISWKVIPNNMTFVFILVLKWIDGSTERSYNKERDANTVKRLYLNDQLIFTLILLIYIKYD